MNRPTLFPASLPVLKFHGELRPAVRLGGEEKIRVVGLAGLLAFAILELHAAVPQELLYDLRRQALPDLREVSVILPQYKPAFPVAAEPSFLSFQHLRAAVRAGADHFISAHQCVCSFHFLVGRYQVGDHALDSGHEVAGIHLAMFHLQELLLPFGSHGR